MSPRVPTADYTIARACKALDATPRAIRYYESCGLVTCPRVGLRRIYSAAVLQRLQFIVQSRRANLSVRQIRRLLEIDSGTIRRALMLEMIQAHVEALDAERARLDQILADLRACPTITVVIPGEESACSS